jgi:SGNH hydrolase-like domain, acetyltransferase AlgX
MTSRSLSAFAKLKYPFAVGLFAASIAMFGGFFASQASADEVKFNCPNLSEKALASSFAQPVYQGKDGWFFRRGDLTHQYALTDANVTMLRKIDALLSLKGVNLFLLPVPSRGIMGGDFIQADGIFEKKYMYDQAFAEQQFKELILQFMSHGLAVIDVLQFMGKHPELKRSEFYLKRDIHWKTTGASWTADAAAETIRSRVTFTTEETRNFTTTKTGQSNIATSVVNLALNQVCLDKLPHEKIEAYENQDNSQNLDVFLADSSQLKAPVHLVGTSFSVERFKFNFAGFLRSSLQADVADYALTGGGMDQSFFDWSHKGDWIAAPPKVLIWEFPYIDRLPLFSEKSARQIVPALSGLCADSESVVQQQAFDAQNKVVMKVSHKDVTGSKFYIASDLSDPTLRAPSVKLTYDDGKQEDVSLLRPERVQVVSKLFWEISDLYTGDLTSVEVEFDSVKTETGTLAICKYPNEVTQQASN